MLKTWSISTGSGRAAVSGIVEPGSKPWLGVAAVDLEVLEPERRLATRTTMVESSGSGSRSLLSSMFDLGDLAGALPGRVVRAGSVVDVLGVDRLDLTDAAAADPDLVALDEGVRRRAAAAESW